MSKIDGPFNPKYKKLHFRAYLLGTVSDVEIDKNDGNLQLVHIREPPKGIAHAVLEQTFCCAPIFMGEGRFAIELVLYCIKKQFQVLLRIFYLP